MSISVSFTVRFLRAENLRVVGQNAKKAADLIFQNPTPANEYDKPFKVQALGDKAENFINGVAPGAVLIIHVNISGSEYQGKTYTSLDLWKWETAPQMPVQGQPAQQGWGTQQMPVQGQPMQTPQMQMPTQGQPMQTQTPQMQTPTVQAPPAAPVASSPNPPVLGSMPTEDKGFWWSFISGTPFYFNTQSQNWVNHTNAQDVRPQNFDLPF